MSKKPVSKKATVQYRELKTEGPLKGMELKDMLVDVLRRRGEHHTVGENARLRIIDLDQDGSFVILNKVSPPDSWDGAVFCGQLIHLQAGADIQAVIQSLDEDTDEFLLQNIDVGPAARVLKGVLYFAVNKNHVGLIEGHAVKGQILERYLTALFQKAEELAPGQQVILNGQFSAAGEKGLKELTDLTISARPKFSSADDAGRIIEDERQAGQARDEGHTVFDVLELMGWPKEALDRLEQEIPQGGRIEGLFKVFIKNSRSKVRIPRVAVNEALRNFDPADLGLQGDGREKGGMVKLAVIKDVKAEGSLLDPEDAMMKIVEALKEWAATGKIDCRFEA
ncbi:hypothetical protein [Paracoccus sp. DMF]|uniref:hypothetical protein n=1 Tax=Paracoccus sp. DMF TaxID=400837 RepID=UPI0011006D69|nr:hypothetical protein [Paracoccus sp. DMF]MCV2449512.1 hypothetical protein [Paracoccus sp. DMF]